jgi:hypothetical protein
MVASTCLLAAPAFGEIIGSESFDYPNGPISGKTGGTFWDYRNFTPVAHTGTPSGWENFSGAPVVTSGRLVTESTSAKRKYNGDFENDGAVNDPASSPSSVAKSVFYRVTLTTGATVPAFFGISSYDFGDEKLFFGKRSGQAKFGILEQGVGSTDSTTTPDILPNTTYTLVVRLNYATDDVSLFINPDFNATEASLTPAVSRTYTGTNWSTAVRLASGGGSPVAWDDLVVATNWDDLGTDVTTLADEDDGSLGGGNGISLREAVKYSAPGTLVTFAPDLSGNTITLTAGEMFIPSSLTIDATALPGGLTVDGNNASRHFQLQTGKSLTLRGLTLMRGNAFGDGGAIYSEGILNLDRCTLAENFSAFDGGAIGSIGTLSLAHCTLSGNSAARLAGGILSNGSATTVTASTISGNSARGGGGIASLGGIFHLTSSIVAGNSDSDGAPNISGPLSININNLTSGDPKLSPLGHFGGPVMTLHPLIGSPAIDTGGTTNPGGTDARGFPRYVDGDDSATAQLDIGAVEAGPVYRLDSATDLNLRQLITIAGNASTPGVRIRFNLTAPSPVITLTSPLTPAAGKMIFLDASDLPSGLTLSGKNATRIFDNPSGATLALHSLILTGGNGGAIQNLGSLHLQRCILTENRG